MIKILLAFIFITNQLFALDLQNLLSEIQQESKQEMAQENKRLQDFINDKNKQQQILNNTKALLKKENARTERLKNTIDQNEKILIKQETLLNTKVGDLGEMFGSVRQISADFLTNYQSSLSASQSPEKKEIFEELSHTKKLPNTDELRVFWHTMLDEIIKSGEIAQYKAAVVLNDGVKSTQIVTKVGQFAAVSQGKYFQYDSDVDALVELSTQPSSSIQNTAKDFENTQGELKNIVIDPTKGSLLSLLNMKPTMMDRVHQGGVIGYIIIALGLLGLLFAFYKIVLLSMQNKMIATQMKNLNNPSENNALGKIAKVFDANKGQPLNDLEITMNEAILKEVNVIKSGESFIKLLAAVTPLLGLLGTVTGMIATFQAITLFGTGDPKLMAGGISTALMTTVLGLVAAIPLLFAYTYLASTSNKIVSILEEQSIGMLAKNLK
ncbi:MAG: MotA/TolQ/ExbB proton channel family protein [Arcobacteraceae bacterium]